MNFKTTLQKLDVAMIKLRDFMKPDKEYILEIKVAKDIRSLSQNEYYWAVVIPIFMKRTGYTKNESHELLKNQFLGYRKESHNGMKYGTLYFFTKSTTDLNTKEFEDYLESCRLLIWHEFQEQVPKPNELTEEQLMALEKLNKY